MNMRIKFVAAGQAAKTHSDLSVVRYQNARFIEFILKDGAAHPSDGSTSARSA
jgi:hypothetical protein